MNLNLTVDARLLSNSGIGVYIQNVISNPLLQKFKLKLLFSQKDKTFFDNLGNVELSEYNAELYSINELLETSARTKGSDIFWSPHYNVPLWNSAAKLKVTTIHDVFHLAYFETLSIKQKIYAKLMMSKATSSSDIIFTVSDFSKAEIIKYTSCKPDKIHVVYNGIDFAKFSTRLNEESQQAVLAKYSLNYPYFLYVGNVKPHKNLVKALLGYKLFIEGSGSAFKETRFVIVGKKEGFITGDEEVAKMLSQPFFEANVIFTGWVNDEDLPVLYQRSLLFIFPSLYEGFGFPPLEAMAAGCPVISSSAACLPEIYGDSALYFDPKSESEISEAMFQVLSGESLRARLIEKGIARSRKFSWDRAVEKKIEVIEKQLQ